MALPNKMVEGEDSREMGHEAPSTPMLVLKLLILTLTHFHSSKALYSESKILTIPGSQGAEMGGCLPRIQPLFLLIPLSEHARVTPSSWF